MTLLRKVMCWLGWHMWQPKTIGEVIAYRQCQALGIESVMERSCKHCGKRL